MLAFVAYTPLVDNFPTQLRGTGGDLGQYVNAVIIFAIGLAGILAVIMIIVGGVQYVSTDSWSGKSDGKNRIMAALGGLLLALASFLILNTIDPNLTTINFKPTQVGGLVTQGGQIGVYNSQTGQFQPVQGPGIDGTPLSQTLYNNFNNIPRGNDGAVLTSYGYAGDTVSDPNSSKGLGNRNNRLLQGSVALSPDLIQTLKPNPGAAVYVGGTLVGYYDDSTGDSYEGRPLRNIVDVYDPTGTLGGNNFRIKTSGAVTVDNTKIRAQPVFQQ